MSELLTARRLKVAPPADPTIEPRCGLVLSADEPAGVLDAGSYALRAARRAAFAAYALALDSGLTQPESFAAALSGWRKFRPNDSDVEVHENVVPVVLAVLDLHESDKGFLVA